MKLRLEGVTKCYDTPGKKGEGISVLQDISLTVKQGQSLSILGPSGSGKSTLLNLMGGLDYPTSGKVIIDNQDLAVLKDKELAMLRNKRIGFVFQLHHLLPQCTVLENVLIPTLVSPPDDSVPGRAAELLEQVGLKDRIHHKPHELSGGEKQRVALARALILQPQLVLCDEPTGNLDPELSREIMELFLQFNQVGVTLLVATHDVELISSFGKRIVNLRDGRVADDSGGPA